MGLSFLLHSPMKENKTQRKEAEDEGVFFWLGDDLAVDSDLYGSGVGRRKSGKCARPVEGSHMEVADGFVDQAGARPS